MPRTNAQPIRSLADLPKDGFVHVADFCSAPDDIRLMPFTQATWARRAHTGDAPPRTKLFGRNVAHAAHVRAIATGKDWRKVSV